MALTATATQGFEPAGKTTGDEIFYLPGDPGATYTRGDRVCMGGLTSEASATNGLGGVLKGPSVTGDKNLTGVVMKTTVCPAATQAFPKPKDLDPVYNDAEDKCLVPVKIDVAAGHQIFHASFASHVDDTVAAIAAGTRSIQATTGHATDAYPIGALLYVYEGPGAGEVNIVEDYDHTGGNVELEIITHRSFAATLTTASKYIVLAGEAAADTGIPLMGRIDAADLNGLTANNGSNDGEYIVFCDWRRIGDHLKNLRLPVIRASAMYSA